jgi:hypothetical protein
MMGLHGRSFGYVQVVLRADCYDEGDVDEEEDDEGR